MGEVVLDHCTRSTTDDQTGSGCGDAADGVVGLLGVGAELLGFLAVEVRRVVCNTHINSPEQVSISQYKVGCR